MKTKSRNSLRNRIWYQKYRTRRIRFKYWRYQQDWYRKLVIWLESRNKPGYVADRSDASPGTADWLIDTEIRYGGYCKVVYPTPVPQPDPRDGFRIGTDGDRMFHHGYAVHYERFLNSYVQNRNQRFVICEVGILNGSRLAIWCDLFPNSRVIGLDIDTSIAERNMDNLLELGAFSDNSPELYTYDQMVDSTELLNEVLNGDRIDIFIDDGAHFDDAIMTTLRSALPHLSDRFVYFVEDNANVHRTIELEYPKFPIYVDGELTVITWPSGFAH